MTRANAGRPLSILLYGDFHPERLGASYERAFIELGHSVIRFDAREMAPYLMSWTRARVPRRLTARSLSLRRAGTRSWNLHLLAAVRSVQPDLLFILNGDLLMPETILAARTMKVPAFVFHADNPFPPYIGNHPETLPLAQVVDRYFIWSLGLRDRLRRDGVLADYLPFGWDETLFPAGSASLAPRHDVVFIGGWDRERERFLEPIARRFDLKIWGPPYWRTRALPRSAVRSAWQGTALDTVSSAGVMTNSRIVLNTLRRQNLPDGTNMRTFEVPGTGAFLLSTRTTGAVELYPEPDEGAYFSDGEECCALIARFLGDDAARRAIACRAHALTAAHHRYSHRAQTILDVFQAPVAVGINRRMTR